MGSASPGQVALDYVRKLTEKATEGKPESVVSVSVPASVSVSDGL